MKSKFATFDLCAVLHDLRDLQGMRVSNVYDINSKTYLIKLQRPNEKAFILFESGIRIHTTTYDWQKSTFPSGFSMKFRKHINTRRLTAVNQIGVDRVVDLQFGDAERACHVIVELYDRGNVVLTDFNYTILNILRPRTDHDHDVRFSVKERYPLECARQQEDFLPSQSNILLFLQNAKTGDPLRKSLVKHVPFGAQLLDHAFAKLGIPLAAQIGVHIPPTESGAELIGNALAEADRVSKAISTERSFGGFIAYVEVPRAAEEGQPPVQAYKEYYPYDFAQYRLEDSKFLVLHFEKFSEAVDKFYSSIDSQKVEHRVVEVEKEADKRLQNVKRDHEVRLQALGEVQKVQMERGELLLYNRELVEQALLLVRVGLANMSWAEIGPWLEGVAARGDQPAAKAISRLQLDSNRFTMRLSNPYEEDVPALNVDIDISLNADQNARRFFDEKRAAHTKQEKTASASKKALKSAQQQAKNKVNKVKTRQTNVVRARRTYWFEKFLWFISSDGYIVLAGREAQQNELLVKRYMRPGDIYVHAEIQGAASVVVRNKPGGEDPPPRTLNEAGTMAICFSSAWEANVSVTAWWVRHDQVSRTAPTGQFLVPGSFMIRGKRNPLPPCQLQLGFGLLFKLDDESAERHRQMRKEELESKTTGSTSIDDSGSPSSVAHSVIEDHGEEDEQTEEEASLQDETEEPGQHQEAADEPEFPDVQIRITGSDQQQQSVEPLNDNEEQRAAAADENAEEEEGEGEEDDQLLDANAGGSGDDQALIDTVTAQPLDADQLLYVLPVCAPYTAMQRFKFKVKITPGTGKRGKAVKQALELFNRDKSLSLAERTLLRNLAGDDRPIQQLPGKVRVSAPALNIGKHK